MLKIYHMPGSRSTRVVWVAEELGLPYELIIKQRTELKDADFLAINPLGSAPAIDDDGVTMIESSAIVEYLVERYGADCHLASPALGPHRAAYLQWLHFPEASLMPQITFYILASGRFSGAQPNEHAMQTAREKLTVLMDYIDGALAGHSFITGDHFTGADIALYWCLMIGRDFQAIDLAQSQHVRSYLRRLEDRAELKKALEIPRGFVNQPPGSVRMPSPAKG